MKVRPLIRRPPAFRRGFEAVVPQGVLERMAGDFVPEIVQGTANARVSPARILASPSHHQLGDILFDAWSSRPARFGPVVLRRDQVAVPPEQRVRRHDGAKLRERRPADGLGLFGESATLLVRPPKAPLAKLFAQCLIPRPEGTRSPSAGDG